MDRMLKWVLAALIISLLSNTSCLAYKVTGTLKNLSCFYPKIYLAVINNIDGIYSASNQDIIAYTDVDSNGSFTLSGNDLPDNMGFYRLYVTSSKEMNTAITCGPKKNYILLALNNSTDVNIRCDNFCIPYFVCTITNSSESDAILSVQNILTTYDSILEDSIGASKKQFLGAKKYAALKQFADTSRHLLAAVWAVIEMNIDSNFSADQLFFTSFARRFRKDAHAPTYARQLDEKIQIIQFKNGGRKELPWLPVIIIISTLLGCSVLLNIYLVFKKTRTTPGMQGRQEKEWPAVLPAAATEDQETVVKSLLKKLTIKEREILKMVNKGLSNKEIAEQLFVEVSTVKSHISNIYQKTGITNRKQVAGIAGYL